MKRTKRTDTGTRPGGLLAYLEVLFVTMAAAITGVLYSGFFTSRDYLLPLLVAAGGAALLAVLTSLRRWGVTTTLLVAVLGFAVLAVGLVYRDTLDHGLPTVHTATSLGTGLLHGWARMLSVGLPADVSGDLMITPVLVTWIATFVSTTVALRTRVVLGPALPTLLALVIGLLFTAGRPAAGAAVTAAWLLVTLLLVIVRVSRLETAQVMATTEETVPGAGAPPRRLLGRIAFGIPVALLVTAIGVGGAQLVPVAAGTNRFDPRSVTPQRYDIEDTLTPLVGIKAQLREDPARTLFTARVGDTGGLTVDRVRTAALDTYDGSYWTSGDSFLVAGHTLPADPNLEHSKQVPVRIQLQDLSGPYLPVVGWPVKVDASGLGFSSASGVLVDHDTNLRGLSYDLVGELPRRDDGLKTAVPNLSGAAAHDTQLPPGLPPELEAKARELTGQATTPFGKLTAIETYLKTLPYSIAPEARPGHSYDALRRLVSPNTTDRQAYAEQFAAAFAVLARSQGFPTRVAVGYLLRDKQGGDTYAVKTSDAHAWAEVNLTGYGWVSFDPTNFSIRPETSQQKPQTQPGGADKPNDTPLPGSQPIVDPHLTSGPGTRERVITTSVIVAGVLVALFLLTLLGIVLEKARRRARRRMGSGNDRIVGAWREVTDRLVEHGVDIPRSLTAAEAAAHAEEQLGEPARAVAVLAPMVTAAVYYPGEPLEDNVREAWELSGQFRRDLRRSRGMLRATRAKFDPRPLTYSWRDRRRLHGALKEMQEG
jgi:transglutaminase-like putative cysteine protease